MFKRMQQTMNESVHELSQFASRISTIPIYTRDLCLRKSKNSSAPQTRNACTTVASRQEYPLRS